MFEGNVSSSIAVKIFHFLVKSVSSWNDNHFKYYPKRDNVFKIVICKHCVIEMRSTRKVALFSCSDIHKILIWIYFGVSRRVSCVYM